MTPGFHDGIEEAAYHGDRASLSVSGAKVLLKAPALFRQQQDHPVTKDVFDVGSAAHKLVLGVGDPIYVVPADDWRTKVAKEERDEARAEGYIPILPETYEQVSAMADKLSEHTLAMSLLSGGKPEVSAYCVDEPTGVLRRCRYDYLRDDLAVDYKSCASCAPWAFSKACADFGYHQQAAWYLDVAADLGKPLRGFVFIAQMKEPPYLVECYELEATAVQVGRERNRAALERFRDCTETGIWPGFTGRQTITALDIPSWAYANNDLEVPA